MSILEAQRIFNMRPEESDKAFGPTGSKSGGAPGTDGASFIYNSPSNVYSPPSINHNPHAPTMQQQFHQSGVAPTGLAGDPITANASRTVYGPDRNSRIGPNHNTLLTSLAKLNAGLANLNTAYRAHDYFDSRQPRALRSYFEDSGSSDPDFKGGYDADWLYPDRSFTTAKGEFVPAPKDEVFTGLRRWLTNTPEDSGAQGGGTEGAMDIAFSTETDRYSSVQIAFEELDFLADRQDEQQGNLDPADRKEYNALRKALGESDGE